MKCLLQLKMNRASAVLHPLALLQALRLLLRFISEDLSATFIEVARDRLYLDHPKGYRRRSCQVRVVATPSVFHPLCLSVCTSAAYAPGSCLLGFFTRSSNKTRSSFMFVFCSFVCMRRQCSLWCC